MANSVSSNIGNYVRDVGNSRGAIAGTKSEDLLERKLTKKRQPGFPIYLEIVLKWSFLRKSKCLAKL